MRYIFIALTIMFFGTGCTRGVNGLPVLNIGTPATGQTDVAQATIEPAVVDTSYEYPAPEEKKTKKISKRKPGSLKPEPYSIGSGKKDPELLGPETTIKREPKKPKIDKTAVPTIQETDLTKKSDSSSRIASLGKAQINANEPKEIAEKSTSEATKKEVEKNSPPPKQSSSVMTRSECLKMIGESKFTEYSKKFGGEKGAIKRCAILKRLKR